MCLGGQLHAADRLAVGEAHVQHAGFVEQFCAGFLLDLLPKLIGIAQQRHVVGMLLITQPDDTRVAVVG